LRAGSSAARAVPATEAARPEGHRGVAVGVDLAAVETGALVLVAQQVIGLGDVGETLRRLRIVLVAIGVQFLGKLAVGGLDVLLARVAGNAQGGIGIGHGVLARWNTDAAQARDTFLHGVILPASGHAVEIVRGAGFARVTKTCQEARAMGTANIWTIRGFAHEN
jgi:hypothetical protein